MFNIEKSMKGVSGWTQKANATNPKERSNKSKFKVSGRTLLQSQLWVQLLDILSLSGKV